jgi:hypothetical protein
MQTAKELVAEKSRVDDEWAPAPILDGLDGLDRENFVYRWADKRPGRIKKLMAEGWSFVNSEEGDHVLHRRAQTGQLDSGRALTSEVDFREVVMMKLPMAKAESRRRYFQRKTDKAVAVINRDVAQEARNLGGEITPKAMVKSGSVTTVIE